MVWPEENAEWSAGASAQVEDKCKWRLWSGGTCAKVSCEQMRRGEAGSQEGVQVKHSLGEESPSPSLSMRVTQSRGSRP